MSKSPLQGLVQGLARDLRARGITISNVQPGPINTDMNPDKGEFAQMLKKQFMALPRYGTAEEVAAMVAYLVPKQPASHEPVLRLTEVSMHNAAKRHKVPGLSKLLQSLFLYS